MKKARAERSRSGFTLVELLVVMSVLAIAGMLILVIFTNTLKGNNKTQIVGIIKQNGQAVLEVMDKTIRDADRVVCVTYTPPQSIVTVKDGLYTRYRFTPAVVPTSNGYFTQETFGLPATPPPGTNSNFFIRDFEITLCTDPSVSSQQITDTNLQTGISVDCQGECTFNPIYTRDKSAGYKDRVTIKFAIAPAVGAPPSVAGQIDAVQFQTTVQLR